MPACDITLNPGDSVTSAVTVASAGAVVCLNAGSYGSQSFNNIVKSSPVTVRSASGQTATIAPDIGGNTSGIIFDSLTISGADISGTTKDITISNSRFTGQLLINMNAVANANILINGNTFDGISVSPQAYEGRLQIRGGTYPIGVLVTNNHFGGAGESDGIQVGGPGAVIGPGNVFDGIIQGSYSRHVDAVQGYGQSQTTITGNYFKNCDTFLMFPDGGTAELINNNVFDGGTSGNNGIQLGTHDSDVFEHNTVRNVTVNMDKKMENPTPSRNNMTRNNIMVGSAYFKTIDSAGVPSCTNCTFDHNLFTSSGNSSGTNAIVGTPVFVGGSVPSTLAGWKLAAGSPGIAAATDGKDLGSTYFGQNENSTPMTYIAPRRFVSSATTLDVASAQSSPTWLPTAGKFNDVRRADNDQIELPSVIDINYVRADGSATKYPNLFRGPAGGFEGMWLAQGGGCFNAELGALGSMMFMNGGHNFNSGCCMARFDFATGRWSQFVEPIYAATDKTISGGTVAAGTGTVVNRVYPYNPNNAYSQEDLNNRVSDRGNYCRYADDTPIPGTGPLTGGLNDLHNTDVDVWYPFPVHSGAGIRCLPSDAGGGPNGSIIIFSHSQTGITLPTANWQIFKLDCATKVWSAGRVGEWNPASLASPMLDYDPNRKMMWGQFTTGRLIALRWHDDAGNDAPFEKVRLAGPSINQGMSAQPAIQYLPDRDMMVWIAVVNSGGVNRYPRWQGLKFDNTPWSGLTAFNKTAFNLIVNGFAPGQDGYLAGLLAGTNTGWPSWRKAGNVAPLRPTYSGEVTYLGCADGGDLFANQPGFVGGYGTVGGGINDRMMWCPDDGCLYMIERYPGTDIRIWRLKGPAIGSETTGSWDWQYQDCTPMPACTGSASTSRYVSPSYSGFFDWIPAIKSFYVSNFSQRMQVIKPDPNAWQLHG